MIREWAKISLNIYLGVLVFILTFSPRRNDPLLVFGTSLFPREISCRSSIYAFFFFTLIFSAIGHKRTNGTLPAW